MAIHYFLQKISIVDVWQRTKDKYEILFRTYPFETVHGCLEKDLVFTTPVPSPHNFAQYS